ncbi:MAG: tRNA (N(6)-L-threonylcarbamoyladenosine(37)-C(2))-methylthiotransferase MtaB [Mollicutes bacterium]|nr:tRNA (N(6)-L-threonylcarbamoyladenosine(37)-C(2))-methylthiotransferase MtaB [Mollicutes bacterium]
MKFLIKTLGCKVNNYESEMIKEKLISHGFSEDENNPDICIVNTCTVTNQADSKSRQMLRRCKKEFPNSIIIVCGCITETKKENLEMIEADIILGNYYKPMIVHYINEYLKNKEQIIRFEDLTKAEFERMNVSEYDSKTRAFIKIQDGCNNFCSYCIIPYVRGRVRSKDFNEAVEEIKMLAKTHQEIVLTGIHTGSYFNNKKDLTDLIQEISKINELKRIRISSIEITEINYKFLDELKNNEKICNHLHIPLQSGSDEILKSMNRKYNLKYFLDKVNQIRSIRPDINLTTDLIIGFPGETAEHFQETIETLEKLKFTKIHVFPYSVREGTVAAKLPNQINGKIKKERVKQIIEISNNQELEYAKKFIDQELDVLIEQVNEKSIGHTDNYLEITINEKLIPNKTYKVKITELKDNKIVAKLI